MRVERVPPERDGFTARRWPLRLPAAADSKVNREAAGAAASAVVGQGQGGKGREDEGSSTVRLRGDPTRVRHRDIRFEGRPT